MYYSTQQITNEFEKRSLILVVPVARVNSAGIY